MGNKNQYSRDHNGESENSDFAEIKLLVPEETARAWQRCSWIIAHETGKKRTDIMFEMVHDFLVKHGC